MEPKPEIILVDMEGTLSDSRHRGQLFYKHNANNWHNGFAQDIPNAFVKQLVEKAEQDYIIMSAKPLEYSGLYTIWLQRHMTRQPLNVYMRPCGSFDTSPALKEKWLVDILSIYDVVVAIDDRADICAMYRRYDIPTLQFKTTL